MRTTPFHERTAALNETQLWHHWAGYLVAEKYQHSVTFEYFGTRNAVAIFDTSPLFKYRIAGPDATDFLAGVLTRDIRKCAVGEGQYTVWCDDAGHVIEDGVVLRLAEDEYWLTAAEPNLALFSGLAGRRKVDIVDMSEDFGMLAVQGPHALDVVRQVIPSAGSLEYFGVLTEQVDRNLVTVSRTGFTGDLGYEIWVERNQALVIWDALMDAGAGYNIVPMGMRALGMARLDAGLLLIDVDFSSARFAWNDAQRETPDELGVGWMIRRDDDRTFIGKRAIERERSEGSTRWKTVGLRVDVADYERLFNEEGLIAPKDGFYSVGTHSLYDADFDIDRGAGYVGYVTSLMFSPVLKRHIGLAKVAIDRAKSGEEMFLELMVSHRPKYVRAAVSKAPFYNPARKTAAPKESA